MTHYDISILLPTIRTHLLEDLYDSIIKACPRHTFQLVAVGPFDLPTSLKEKNNVKYIKDYGCPSRAMQIALLHADGKLIQPLVDDCFYYPDALSNTIDIFNGSIRNLQYNDILGMRFFENPEHYQKIKSGETDDQNPEQRKKSHPDNYWFAAGSYSHLKGIKPQWMLACLFIANRITILSMGGWDCQFEYINHSTHDLLCRLQKHESVGYITEYDCFVANWYQGTTMDHAPIHYGQTEHDAPLFNKLWGQPNDRFKVNLDNYKDVPDIWDRRFNNSKPTTYQEMMNGLNATSIP